MSWPLSAATVRRAVAGVVALGHLVRGVVEHDASGAEDAGADALEARRALGARGLIVGLDP